MFALWKEEDGSLERSGSSSSESGSEGDGDSSSDSGAAGPVPSPGLSDSEKWYFPEMCNAVS